MMATMRKGSCILRARGGSSVVGGDDDWHWDVFSAHAEVVPFDREANAPRIGILRARGGSSTLGKIADRIKPYSPRTRR